jgi:hypothetical protein
LDSATGKWDLEKGQFAHVFAITGEFLAGQLLDLPICSALSIFFRQRALYQL